MRCTYSLTIEAICPIHGVDDRYELTVHSDATVYVERLTKLARSFSGRKLTQEDLTQAVARHLRGMTVTTVGYHSGVKAVVTERFT